MKKIILLLLSIGLLSCSKDNDQTPVNAIQTPDPIIGIWTKTAVKYEFQNGTIENQTITGCDLQDRFIINTDGTFQEINFGLSVVNNNCIQQTSSFTGSKIWVKANNGNYFFRTISTNANFDTKITVVESAKFESNKMTLRIRETEVDNSDPNAVIFYEETYQKN